MTRKSPGVILLGLFFIGLGLLWGSVVYTRAKAVLPSSQRAIVKYQPPAVSYQELKNEMQVELARPSVIDNYVKTPVEPAPPARPNKIYLRMFWFLICIEVACCFLYIFTGASLLRGYPLARFLVFLTLYTDLVFKGMVMIYMEHWAIPLEMALKGTNILCSYFLAGPTWAGFLSGYLTGIKIFQSKGTLFLFIYCVYLFTCFYFFTRPQIKKQFVR